MKARLSKIALTLLAAGFLAGSLQPLFSCGPFFEYSVFNYHLHPDLPFKFYASGDLGVLQPTYARSYLYTAYRYLNQTPPSATEQETLKTIWAYRLGYSWGPESEAARKPWMEMRAKVPRLAAVTEIDIYRSGEDNGNYINYLNCPEDAFQTAANSLQKRIEQYGAESPAVKSWVTAQDQVFANCSQPAKTPDNDVDALEATAGKSDHAYQVASALFYAGKFDEARAAFESISQDSTSPYHKLAHYLVARTWIRKALALESTPPEQKTAALSQAEASLNKILTDASLSELHPASQRLLNLVSFQLQPDKRLDELAVGLTQANPGDGLYQNVIDYIMLMDKMLNEDPYEPKRPVYKEVPAAFHLNDLTDWIITFQATGEDATTHALSRWEQKQSLPWLVASLAKINPNDPQQAKSIPALRKAAEAIPVDSPAYLSVTYYANRLLLHNGQRQAVRQRVEAVLSTKGLQLPPSTRNLFLGQRMLLAQNLTEFLQDAARVPAGNSLDMDGRELPEDFEEKSLLTHYPTGPLQFEDDAASILNERMSLAMLNEATKLPTLPQHLKTDLARAAWVRAVLLGNTVIGQELATRLKAWDPTLSKGMQEYLTASTPEAKRFAGSVLITQNPGLRPYLTPGVGRRGNVNELDNFHDNWWCEMSTKERLGLAHTPDYIDPAEAGPETTPDQLPFPHFMKATQRTAASQERAQLASIGVPPNYLASRLIEWAGKNPSDPRLPEALHRVVKTPRYTCTNTESGKFSKKAFELLHKQYAKTQWAKQTPYWFAE